jgi:lipopolysaccharide biosynthesis glycosyltransferase
MNLAVFQIMIGEPGNQRYCIQSVNKYCKKFGIKHFISQEFIIKKLHLGFEKYQLFKLFEFGIDRVLYLDADIMITPSAENIFEKYRDPNFFYAYDENGIPECTDRDRYIFEKQSSIEWPINAKNKKQYFNTGVMLFSKETANKFFSSADFNDIPNWPNISYFGEQTVINYWAVKNKIPFKTIDHSYNRMDLGEDDINNDRYKSNFIHYAGPCRYGNKNKSETIKNDYENLYGK